MNATTSADSCRKYARSEPVFLYQALLPRGTFSHPASEVAWYNEHCYEGSLDEITMVEPHSESTKQPAETRVVITGIDVPIMDLAESAPQAVRRKHPGRHDYRVLLVFGQGFPEPLMWRLLFLTALGACDRSSTKQDPAARDLSRALTPPLNAMLSAEPKPEE